MKTLSLNRPHALIMVGIPGSGKTTFAKHFADTFNAPYIEAALIAAYARDDASAVELTTLILGEFMKTGQSILIDAYTDSRRVRTELAKYCRDQGYTPLFIWVQTDPETAKRRSVAARQLTKEDFDRQLHDFSPPHQTEKPLVISGKHTYATQAKAVLKRLSAPRAEMSQRKPAPARSNLIKIQ